MPSDQFHRVEKLTGECENIRYIGADDNPAFENSWANYGNGYQNASFHKDKFNRVWLDGVIAGGTVDNSAPFSPAFHLPEGYRPQYEKLYDQVDGTRAPSAVIHVDTDGGVSINKGDNTYISLDGISWRV